MRQDQDVPSIELYRAWSMLHPLGTGVGPLQRQAVVDTASDLGPVDGIVVVNSHGHIDHLGNYDVVDDIAAVVLDDRGLGCG